MMSCIAPPALSELALLAYNEGDGDPATIAHLESCEHCRERAANLAQLNHRLSAFFYRQACVSTDDLQDYQLGFLPAAQVAAITAHLQQCPHCTRELMTLARFLQSDELTMPSPADPSSTGIDAAPPGVGLLTRIHTIVAEWLQGGLGAPAPALAGLRGAESGQILYRAGDLQVGVDIQADPQRPQRRALVGTLLGGDLLASAGAWSAHLWQDGKLVAVATLDDLDSFALANLASGEYELIIAGPDRAIGVTPLVVK